MPESSFFSMGTATVIRRFEISPGPGAVEELNLPLVFYDLIWLRFHPVRRLIFFESSYSLTEFLDLVVPQLCESLAKTLCHYLPLAGKVILPANSGRPFSRYVKGDSVSFTVAESDKDFDHLTGNHPRVADDFYVCVPELPPATDFDGVVEFPVFVVQITFFRDKGFCLGFTNHHAIGDASSIFRFIKAWASVNKFGDGDGSLKEKDLIPFIDKSSVENSDVLDPIYWDIMNATSAKNPPPISFPLNRVRSTFILTSDDVKRIKLHVLEKRPGLEISSFVAVTALIWICLAKAEPAAVADDGEPEFIAIAADCRSHLNPPLPESYFGNCLGLVLGETTHGVLKGDNGFAVAAECIHRAIKARINNENGILDGAENWAVKFFGLMGKRLFGVAGSPRFDFYEVDFGWGKAKKFESVSIDSDTSMSLSKSRDFNGGFEIGLSRPLDFMVPFSVIFNKLLVNLQSPVS